MAPTIYACISHTRHLHSHVLPTHCSLFLIYHMCINQAKDFYHIATMFLDWDRIFATHTFRIVIYLQTLASFITISTTA